MCHRSCGSDTLVRLLLTWFLLPDVAVIDKPLEAIASPVYYSCKDNRPRLSDRAKLDSPFPNAGTILQRHSRKLHRGRAAFQRRVTHPPGNRALAPDELNLQSLVPTMLRTLAWLLCVIYSTIPAFWLLIHPRAEYWRSRRQSPYKILLPIWIAMWIFTAAATAPWHHILLYENRWTWIPAALLFCAGLTLYQLSHVHFTLQQLSGLPEISPGHNRQQLITAGIRSRIRHPVYLAHLCEMLAWSTATGLAVCWALTAWAIITGAVMIKLEDRELENRFGEEYRAYQSTVPALLPKVKL